MKKSDVVAHYGTASRAAEAMGVTKASFSQWPEEMPQLRAYQVEILTGGQLMAEEGGRHLLTGKSVRDTEVKIKGKKFRVETNGQELAIQFIGQSTTGWLRIDLADTSMTIYNGNCYLDTGAMLFGPIDNAASKQICGLIAPWIAPFVNQAMEAQV